MQTSDSFWWARRWAGTSPIGFEIPFLGKTLGRWGGVGA